MRRRNRRERPIPSRHRGLKGVLISLILVQIFVVILCLGGDWALSFLPTEMLQNRYPFRVLFFLGMAAGMALTAALIFTALFFSGVFAFLGGTTKPGWPSRALKNLVFAAIMVSLSTAAICGTSWLLIPEEQREEVPKVIDEITEDVRSQFPGAASEPESPSKRPGKSSKDRRR
ncbi:MAG: hypothetical protein ACYTAF_10260 [Planctomycetota bacterium]